MASTTTNPFLSSTFLGTQILLSPPKSTVLPSLCRRKFLLNREPNLTALLFSSITPQALALDSPNPSNPRPLIQAEAPRPSPSNFSPFSQNLLLTAPKTQTQTQTQTTSDLPDGGQWRHSEFKMERVRSSKDGSAVQLAAVDGRRARVIDPDSIGILAMNDVEMSDSEGESEGGFFSYTTNLIFVVYASAGLYFILRNIK